MGGTGLIGRAAARRLAEGGWDVTVASRTERDVPDGFRHLTVDRAEIAAIKRAVDGMDLLVDVIPFRRDDAEQLLALGERVGALIAISSASVYTDASGRSLDDATGPDRNSPFRSPRPSRPCRREGRAIRPGSRRSSTRCWSAVPRPQP